MYCGCARCALYVHVIVVTQWMKQMTLWMTLSNIFVCARDICKRITSNYDHLSLNANERKKNKRENLSCQSHSGNASTTVFTASHMRWHVNDTNGSSKRRECECEMKETKCIHSHMTQKKSWFRATLNFRIQNRLDRNDSLVSNSVGSHSATPSTSLTRGTEIANILLCVLHKLSNRPTTSIRLRHTCIIRRVTIHMMWFSPGIRTQTLTRHKLHRY